MKRSRSPRRSVMLLFTLAGFLLALAPLAAGGDGSSADADPFAALRDSAAGYLRPFKGGGKPQGYVKGGVVLIEGKALSNFRSHLPRKLRATDLRP